MNRKSTSNGANAKWIIAMLTLAMASASYASGNTLVGGGSTLPAVGYVGINAAFPFNLQMYGLGGAGGIAPGSLLGAYMEQDGNPAVSYCQTGDDAGKNIFAGATINGFTYSVQNVCAKNSAGTVIGFGAANVGRSDLTQPNFAAADAPLSATDYSNYQAGHGASGYPTEFPAVAGAIAIAFNLVDSEDNQVTSSEVNFTDVQLCEIFSGEVTNWSDSRLASAFTLTDGATIPSRPINVEYRSDGSGTTFGFSNHLANVCGATSPALPGVFETSQVFTSVVANFFPSGLPSGSGSTLATWTGLSGDPAVADAIGETPNSIGYVETADALNFGGIPPLQIADVNGTSPVSNFGSPLTITELAIIYNEVINNINASNGVAQIEQIEAIPGVTNPPTTSCIALVKPWLYAKPGLLGGLLPSGSYPIVAISYLLGNTNGNGTDLVNTQNLLAFPYTVTQSNVTTIGPGTGLAFLTPNPLNTFTANQVKECLGY